MNTFVINDARAFKAENLANWQVNTTFWLTAHLSHILAVRSRAADILRREAERVGSGFTVVDVGCGNGWMLRLMRELNIGGRYWGLDFNQEFIERLRAEFTGPLCSFQCVDIEEGKVDRLECCGHVVVSAFNLFELAELNGGFQTACSMVAPGGGFLVFHVDPLSQLISIANSLEELKESLLLFQKEGSKVAYDKPIDIDDGESKRVYKGILYTAADFHSLARASGLVLEDFEELLGVHLGRPQSYQLLFWRRPEAALGKAGGGDVAT